LYSVPDRPIKEAAIAFFDFAAQKQAFKQL
jgi:hypothetical protein